MRSRTFMVRPIFTLRLPSPISRAEKGNLCSGENYCWTLAVISKAKGTNVYSWEDRRGFLCFARQKRGFLGICIKMKLAFELCLVPCITAHFSYMSGSTASTVSNYVWNQTNKRTLGSSWTQVASFFKRKDLLVGSPFCRCHSETVYSSSASKTC
uniref:Uncharacterized protein n=1 Tax=Manihot esculenta TaxID=3983 RepID=A0A2C9WKK7_MANES